MSAKKKKLSELNLEILKDKKYRLLKNLLYKYQISIKSVMEKPREDNFIAYSIVKKVSNSGWFTNQRLLALDCTTKEIFYLTKVPNFIINEDESPLEIQNLKSSPLVKERISVINSAKQIKNVIRIQNMLTIQWQSQAPEYLNKKWVFEMTSSQLAKDWEKLINIIKKGKLSDPLSVKKIAVIPQDIENLRKHNAFNISTPKSITDIHSIHMKSQNWNLQGEDKNKIPSQKEYLTPTNKGKSTMIKYQTQNNKFFRKKKTGQQPVNNNKIQDAKMISKFPFINEQGSGDNKASFSGIAKELTIKPPKDIQNDMTQFHPLSQEIREPFDLQFGKIKDNVGNGQNNNQKFMKLHLLKKYSLPSNKVISETHENLSNENLFSEQLRSINNRKGQSSENGQKGNLKSENSLKIQREETMINKIPPLKEFEKILVLPQKNSKRPQLTIDFPKSPSSINKSPYWNTYRPIKELPKLDSTYDWNEVYFKILLEYYNLCCSKKIKNDENILFDVLFKLEKHVQKFEVYCTKGIKNFVDQQILNFGGQKLQNESNNMVKNVRQENFYVNQDEKIISQSQKNVFNEYFEGQKQNFQIPGENELFSSYAKGVTSLIVSESREAVKMRQKIIHFQFQGIHFKVILDQNQLFISNAEKDKDISLRSNQFHYLSEKIKSEWETLFNISYLNPCFIEGIKLPVNYFHIFTPMITVIQYHGLNFYCKAEFNPFLFDRYIKFALNSVSSQKRTQSNQDITNYLQQKLSNTSISYFAEDKLIDRIGTANLCKQFQKHNYFVIDKIKFIENLQQQSIQHQEKQKDDKIIQKEKGDIKDYKRIYTFNDDGHLNSSQRINYNISFQNMIHQNQKLIEIVACLQREFTISGGVRLTSHQTLKNFIISLIPKNILSEKQQIFKLYNLIAIQIEKHRERLQKEDGFDFLLNRNFIMYLIRLLENQIVICLLLSEINLVMRDFLTNLHFETCDYKSQLTSNKEASHFVNIYNTPNKKQNPKEEISNAIVFIKDFDWTKLSKITKSQHNTFANLVHLNDLKPCSNKQLSQLILNLIVNKAVNEIFLFETQNEINSQTKTKTDKKIKLKPEIIQWIAVKGTRFNQDNVKTLDTNFIYEGILNELSIEKYFDPIDSKVKSLQNEFRISKTPKKEVQKLIKDPYFSSSHDHISKNSQLLEIKDDKKNINGSTQKSQQVEYIGKLNECQDSRSFFFGYGVSRVTSLLLSSPLSEIAKQTKIFSDLQEIHSLVLEKDFNSAIEIYYLLINSNKKSSQIYYEYFKSTKNIKNKLSSTDYNNEQTNSSSPALVTYVLATQCVAFAFLQLLYGKRKNNFQDQQPKSTKFRRIVPAMDESKQNQHSQGEKSQFHALILKYNDMSNFGAEIIYGKNHIIYFINQVIFGITKLMNKEINEGRQYFDQCEKIILLSPQIFVGKYLILPVLYHKAQNDLIAGSYRAAILSVRIIMKCVQSFSQFLGHSNQQDNEKYWLQSDLTEVLENKIPELENKCLKSKLNSYNYLCYQILMLCNENDPESDIRKNKQNLKKDIINQLKSHKQIDKKYVKYLKLLWSLETKLMVTDRKWLIRRTLAKLYDKLVKQMDLKNQILNYDLKVLLDPLGNSKFSLNFLNAYVLFVQIFSKSDKYFNFLLSQFQNTQFHELYEYLHHKMSISSKKGSESITLQYYELKRQLFKDIILMMKLTLMIDMKFILQTMISSDKFDKPRQQRSS